MNKQFYRNFAAIALMIVLVASAAPAAASSLNETGPNPIYLPLIYKPNTVIPVKISLGSESTCILTKDGGVKCWGDNAFGQLGNGTKTDSLSPVDVTGLTSEVLAISTGAYHACALTTAHGIKCWGDNRRGQLGDGSFNSSSTPVDVIGLTSGVHSVSAGLNHTCALTDVGAVKCWGENMSGQLGDTTHDGSNRPVSVNNLSSGVKGISAGGYHSCALMNDNEVKCWGDNSSGQLGNGGTESKVSPMTVSNLSDVDTIYAGNSHTCALTIGDRAKCWGWNTYGQVGNDSTNNVLTPVNVSNLDNNIIQIAPANTYTCAVTDGGKARCWGDNNYGQLGIGTTTNSSVPVTVNGLSTGVNSISTYAGHTCALLEDNARVMCWGANTNGQLGNGNRTNQKSPVQVVGLGE